MKIYNGMAAAYSCFRGIIIGVAGCKNMISRNQVKQFMMKMLDLHRDNFIDLLENPEFQANDLEKKELAVHYVTTLFKKELDDNLDSFIKPQKN